MSATRVHSIVHPPMFYFIINEARTRVKIGRSKDATKRLRQIQTGTDEKLLLYGTAPGDRIEEKSLHQRFSKYRLRGEWFEFPPIEDELKEIVSEDRVIRDDRTYEWWEFHLITGLQENDVLQSAYRAARLGLIKTANLASPSYGRREFDTLFEYSNRDRGKLIGEVRGWVWVKMEESGCTTSLLF